jgi:hypothetical protein
MTTDYTGRHRKSLWARAGRHLTGEHKRPVPSYHDLHITTADIPRTSIFNLPYGLEVSCCRTAGWQLREQVRVDTTRLLAGEYDDRGKWLVLDVAGHVIVDSRRDADGDGPGRGGDSARGGAAGSGGDDEPVGRVCCPTPPDGAHTSSCRNSVMNTGRFLPGVNQ